MTLSELVEIIKTHKQVFLTGAGGVGKTYTTELIKSRFVNPIILASTNQAAIILNGETVHNFFYLGTASSLKELHAEDKRFVSWFCANVKDNPSLALEYSKSRLRKLLNNSQLLIIDEVSMIHRSIFDLVYYRFEWCGVTPPAMLLVGDLYQLPPVSKTESAETSLVYNSDYFNPVIIELTKIKRTESVEFALAQRAIRLGKYTENVHNQLESIQNNTFDDKFQPTILVATNKQANKINQERLDALGGDEVTYKAEIETDLKDKSRIDKILKDMPVPEEVTLKVGARVMFVANDKKYKQFYNGLQGTVTEVHSDYVVVETDSNNDVACNKIDVYPFTFTKRKIIMKGSEPEYETELAMTQIPLRVCYAITIHKSQGASIRQIEIDCKGMFERGQFYVAISRATDPKGIKLHNFDRKLVRNQISLPDHLLENTIRIPEVIDDSIRIEI